MEECAQWPLVASSLAVAGLAEFAFATTGFGASMVYQICWQLVVVAGLSHGGLSVAVGNLALFEGPSTLYQVWILRAHLRWRFSLVTVLPYLATLPLGTLGLMEYGGSLWLKRGLGALLLLAALLQLAVRGSQAGFKPQRPSLEEEPRTWSTTMAIVTANVTAGLLRGVVGVASPPYMILLLHFPVDQASMRAVSAVQRLASAVVQGALLYYHDDIQPACWKMYIALIAGGLLGTLLGNRAARHMDRDAYRDAVLFFLTSGALLMLCAGSQVPSFVASCAVGLALPALLLRQCLRRRTGTLSLSLCWSTMVTDEPAPNVEEDSDADESGSNCASDDTSSSSASDTEHELD